MAINVTKAKVGASDISFGVSTFTRRTPSGATEELAQVNSSDIVLSSAMQDIYGINATLDDALDAQQPTDSKVQVINNLLGGTFSAPWEYEYAANSWFFKNIEGIVEEAEAATALVLEASAIAPLMIPLSNWQTDPDEYTVTKQNAVNSDGCGADNFYKFVFPHGATHGMYTQETMLFEGYDLRIVFPYRMSTSGSGNVRWAIYYKAVSPGDSFPKIASLAAFAAVDDDTVALVDTPSATANIANFINTDDFKIPASAYSVGDTIYILFVRAAGNATDTRAGYAEVSDCIKLKLVRP